MASSSTSALSVEVMWEELPEKLLRQVLEHVMVRYGEMGWYGEKGWCSPLRGVSRRWRAVHDGVCQRLRMDDGVTDEVMHMLCGRLPALTFMSLRWVESLTEDGLRAVGGLTTLTELYLVECPNVTDAVLRELHGLTELATLHIVFCTKVTDVGVRELRGLTTLTALHLHGCTHVTDVGILHLTTLTKLTELGVLYTSVTLGGTH